MLLLLLVSHLVESIHVFIEIDIDIVGDYVVVSVDQPSGRFYTCIPLILILILLQTMLLLLLVSQLLGGSNGEFACEATGFYPHEDCSQVSLKSPKDFLTFFFLQMIALTISPQFFRCTDLWGTGQFQQYSFECAEGTVFDPALGVCNWPQVKL